MIRLRDEQFALELQPVQAWLKHKIPAQANDIPYRSLEMSGLQDRVAPPSSLWLAAGTKQLAE
jgi:hypothetical protein